jgi:hypothetical protein
MNQHMEEIKKIIASRKKKTNCFSFYNEIIDWIENGKANAYLINDCVFIFYKINGFYKFYYYVDNFEDIKISRNLLDKYKLESNVSLEFTTKNDKNIEDITESIIPIGFEFYAEYVRVISGASAFNSNNIENTANYVLASLNEVDELLSIMYKEFDVISDDLPSKEDLINLINNKSVLVQHIENKIIFIQIYEYTKGVLYSRMTWIEKKYRKPKYTIDFYSGLDEYLKHLNIKDWGKLRSYGWINKSNKNYKINLKFGAKPDGITCTIFTYKQTGEEK